MRWFPCLLAGAVAMAGCTLFGDRPCEPGRYTCPSADLAGADGGAHPCTLDTPCSLPAMTDSSPAGTIGDLIAVSGRDGEAWIAGTSSPNQGVLLHAQPGQPTRPAAALPMIVPRALTLTTTTPLTLTLASLGDAVYQYAPQTGQLASVPLSTGGCEGRINPAAVLNGALALGADDLWLVGGITNDAAAGLFRVQAGLCQVLPQLESAGLTFYGAWGAVLSPNEPADRVVWTVGDSGTAVFWSFQGASGTPVAQRATIPSGDRLVAVSGSPLCASGSGTDADMSSNATVCAFMITANALYRADSATLQPIPLPATLHAAELTSVFVDGESVWLVGALAGAGLVARYEPKTAAWSLAQGLAPAGGTLRAAWGPGDGSLWIVGDRGTVLYLPKNP